MDGQEINEALERVRDMQTLVLERRRFQGYSGVGRFLGGMVAMLASGVLCHAEWVPSTPHAHLMGWGIVLLAGLALNYGPLLAWSCHRHRVRGDWSDSTPALDALPALAVGAALSLALVRAGQYDLLFGTWMAVFGLVHSVYRRILPRAIYQLGLTYTACGLACLVAPHVRFLDPRPMGLVFGLGEMVGGMVLCRNRTATGQ